MKNIKTKLNDVLDFKKSASGFTTKPINHVYVENPQKDMEFRKDLPMTLDLSHLSKT